MWRVLIPAVAMALSAQAAMAQEESQEENVERGLAFVQANCAQCHAVGLQGDSPLGDAPPFRMLGRRYPLENLAESLAEGIVTGHPSMPEFELDAAQIDDVLAYLESIQQ